MNRTKIPWVLNPDGTPGYTWNPITGCVNGCTYCFAHQLADTRLKAVYTADYFNAILAPPKLTGRLPSYAVPDPFYPRFWPEKIDQIYRPSLTKASPRGIFVCDMSDLFGIGIPEEWTRQVLCAIARESRDRFYLLTKQLQNLAKFSPFPPNCWVGLSVDGTTNAPVHRIYNGLDKAKATLKFLSFEPLLAQTKLDSRDLSYAGIGWVILGSQTAPVRHPDHTWVDEIIAAADKARIPVFIKEPLASHYNIARHEIPL